MGESQKVKLAFNRVEGDLEIKVELKDNIVTEANCIGTMFRGFEQIMQGRAPWDGLVITPRICGICGSAHQYAAVTALEVAQGSKIAPNGTRIRNICLITEEIQSDSRHTFLMFMPDLCNLKYSNVKYYNILKDNFEQFKGKVYKETIENTKKLLEIVAIFGGQWPHSSYMIPGGVTIPGVTRHVASSIPLIDNYIKWYEKSILGCSFDRWLSINSLQKLEEWFEESNEHRKSAIGLFTKFGRSIGLHKLGVCKTNLMTYGSYFDPEKWQPPFKEQIMYRSPGIFNLKTGLIETLDSYKIEEHVKYSWFKEYPMGKHPFDGETYPSYKPDSEKYSWCKAPRYNNDSMEVGPLAQLVINGDPLMTDIFKLEGSNVWSRQFARLHRPVVSILLLKKFLNELLANKFDVNIFQTPEIIEGSGQGMLDAARGALGHWIKVKGGKIEQYQIISPTSWNSSPRDANDKPGTWEETLLGTEVNDINNPIELGHIIRSHDACLVCAVHVINTSKRYVFNT